MPLYARFLKNLCTTKGANSVPKKAFLACSASFIISDQILVKYRDPDCPTISIVIRDQLIHRALLNLKDTVNLKSFTEYEILGLGELKPTKMVIKFSNRSTRLTWGVVGDDVLIRVGEFIYVVDLVAIESDKVCNITSSVPVILGRLF